jgi:DNA-binding transcriptional LysR family regulator
MNLKQLRAFSEVVKTGSVSEAARRLHRTQPAVSAVIASLEDELGVPLFIRKGMRLKPAPEAQFLFREANEILQKVENAKKTMIDVRQTERGVLKIISMPGPTVVLLPFLIDQFLGIRKQVRVALKTKTSAEVEQIISAQNSDMGFADYDLIADHESVLVDHEIFDFDCMCALPVKDPLAQKTVITPEDLDGKPLATLYPEHPVTRQIQQKFKSHNAVFDSYFSAQYFMPLFTFIERGSAYSIMDRMSAQCYFWQKTKAERKIVFRQFVPNITLRTSIITPTYRPMSMLAQEFHKTLRLALLEIQNKDYAREE